MESIAWSNRASPRMSSYLASALGLKSLMAVTGVSMLGFLLAHLSGNLLAFAGPRRLNDYSALLHSMPTLLWIARIGLLASVVGHVWSAIILTRSKLVARPVGYVMRKHRAASYASRTMQWSGPWIAGFILFHILHFTTGHLHADYQVGRPYENLVHSFQSPVVSAVYVVTMGLVGLHLFHGLSSAFQSLGWHKAGLDRLLHRGSAIVSLVLAAGFSSVPIAVLAGWVR